MLEEELIAINGMGTDRRFDSLGRLLDPSTRPAVLSWLFPDQPPLWRGELETLRYKPECRFVGRLTVNGDPAAVVRMYEAHGYSKANLGSKGLASRGRLRTAPRLGRSKRHGLLAFEWINDSSLSKLIANRAQERDALQLTGEALAEIHLSQLKIPRQFDAALHVNRLQAAVEAVGFLCPQLESTANHRALKLCAEIARDKTAPVFSHGDFYPDQILIPDGMAVVLDLDQISYAPGASDLGNFVAWLHWHAISGDIDAVHVKDMVESFLKGYFEGGGVVDETSVSTYTAAGLLALSPKAFRSGMAQWPSVIESLLTTAEDVSSRAAVESTSQKEHALKSRPRKRLPTKDVPVDDPTGAANDAKMPFMSDALDPATAELQLQRNLVEFSDRHGSFGLLAVRVRRHDPGRRCLVEYELKLHHPHSEQDTIVLLGKARARRFDRRTFRVQQYLWRNGFNDRSADGMSVPEPIGHVKEFQMWLQRKVPGQIAANLLAQPGAPDVARSVARAIAKVYAAPVNCDRAHTIDDELDILQRRLHMVAESFPHWKRRTDEIARSCRHVGEQMTPWPDTGIHRDFYPDQVLIDGGRTYLLDFELFSHGNPALDIGNFQAHVVEYSLRHHMKPELHADVERAFCEEYIEQAGEEMRDNIERFVTLTLARHICISSKVPDREHITGLLLKFCEACLEIDLYRQAVQYER
jgi:aminoglycoside phosphotransferase (APT) family kinase protein